MSFNIFGLLSGFLSIIIWSATPVVVTLVRSSASAVSVAFTLQCVGLAAAGIFTLVLYLSKYDMSFLKNIPRRGYKWIVIAGIAESLSYIAFYFAIQNGGAMQATVVHYSWVLILIILSQIFVTNTTIRLNFFQWVLVTVATVGVYFVITGTGDILLIDFKLPLLWALASALFSAINSYAYKRLGHHYAMLEWKQHGILLLPRVFIQVLTAGVVIALLNAGGFHTPFIIDMQSVIIVLYLGIFTLFLSHIEFSYALHNTPTEILSIATYLTPALSLVWLYFFLHQDMSVIAIIGAVIVLSCNILLQIFTYKRNTIITSEEMT